MDNRILSELLNNWRDGVEVLYMPGTKLKGQEGVPAFWWGLKSRQVWNEGEVLETAIVITN